MKQVNYGGFIMDEFTVFRTSKNTYRIVGYDSVHYVVHSQSKVFDFMEQRGIHSFEIQDLHIERQAIKKTVISD